MAMMKEQLPIPAIMTPYLAGALGKNSPAHSTTKCNKLILGVEENLAWGFVSENLSGTRIELILDLLDFGIGYYREVGAFWEVLSDEAVGVFVETTFPGVIGLGEIAVCLQRSGDFDMRGELLAVVVGDGFDAVSQRAQHAGAGLDDRGGGLVGQRHELGVFGLALDMRQDGAAVLGTDDGVTLPVADAAFGRHDGRSLIDVDAVRDQAAPRIPALALVVFLAAVTQVQIQVTPVSLVVPDMPVDA